MAINNTRVKIALLSVSDKRGIVDFARQLNRQNIVILSTGGTAALLEQHAIPVTEVSKHTGFPEIMGGRVKTLHPKIHGGLLARRGQDDTALASHSIDPIDLLVVNLYPFQETVVQEDCQWQEAIEEIDIGGPAMLRAAAKNHESVTVVCDPNDYDKVLGEICQNNQTLPSTRQQLAAKVFAHTAHYDAVISRYFSEQLNHSFPQQQTLVWHKHSELRYGENPHQKAACYQIVNFKEACVTNAKLLQGKPLSYNNLLDADTALECVKQFSTQTACAIVKHANPCGVALGEDTLQAYQQALRCDPTSAFGGIIAFNQSLDATTLQHIFEQQFVEVIIAPQIDDEAVSLARSKPNLRLLCCGKLPQKSTQTWHYHSISGGLLIQQSDINTTEMQNLTVMSQQQPSKAELSDLLFAWKVVQYVKSNAIVYAKDSATLGIGAGQMSRVMSAHIAQLKAQQAKLSLQQAVMSSDAFFPFRDSVDAAAQAGISAIIQPGGSKRDDEVIAAANEAGIAMVFTGRRHFRH